MTFIPHPLSRCVWENDLLVLFQPLMAPTPRPRSLHLLSAGKPPRAGGRHLHVSVQLDTWGAGSEGWGWSLVPSPAVAEKRAIFCCADLFDGHNAQRWLSPKSLKDKGKPTHHGLAGLGPPHGQECDSAATSVVKQCTAALVLRTGLASNHCCFWKKESPVFPEKPAS